MNQPPEPDRPSDSNPLRQEAAAWFARMRGPYAERDRAEFEQWLAGGALHRVAYNRIAEVWSYGKGLARTDAEGGDVGARVARVAGGGKQRLMKAVWLLAASALLASLILPVMLAWRWSRPRDSFAETMSSGNDQLATRLGEIRRIALPDGSSVILDTDSLISTNFNRDARSLRLQRGRARFETARDPRPFVVEAGAGHIIADGTTFDVNLIEREAVRVQLLHGWVLVSASPSPRPNKRSEALLRLTGLQSAIYPEAGGAAPRITTEPAQDWPTGNIEFDDVPIREVIAEANRYSAIKILVSDPSLGALRVSGTFRVDDASALASRLARLFNLGRTTHSSEIILVKR